MLPIILQKITSYKAKIGVIGMGYIGLSLIEAFGKKGFSLLGYDRDTKKVHRLEQGKSCYNFIPFPELSQWIQSKKLSIASDPSILKSADILVLSVSTSLDCHKVPNVSAIQEAFYTLSHYLKKGCLIVLQSTTYPGTTAKELLPILERVSGLQVGKDFFLAYVPEISDPGNPNYCFTDVPRIVGGITQACLQATEALYQTIGCSTVSCSSTEIAEAAKLLQNTYRLVNISLMNEMKVMFDRMGIDIWEVIEAASVKPFGFTPFYPGPGIGGDCIAVVPAYLSWKAAETDGPTSLIDLSMTINASIPHYVVGKIAEALGTQAKSLSGAKILIFGLGYKKDVNDLRESASLKILSLLQKKSAHVDYHDPYIPSVPHVDCDPSLALTCISLTPQTMASYDVVVIGTDHSSYDWQQIAESSKLIVDTRNVMSKIEAAKGKTIKA